MELLKQKLKIKKYQYKYLWSKVSEQSQYLFWLSDHCGKNTEKESKRIGFYFDWLNKINKKYNYV